MKRCMCLTKIAVGRMLILAGSVQAQDFYVAQGGQPPVSPFTNGWDNAASNIQAAVNVAAEGDTVWVRPGRYVAPASPTNFAGFNNVVYMDKLVSLRAANDVPGRVLIDGEGVNRGIAVDRPAATSAQLLLEGLSISNCILSAAVGADAFGAGIHLAIPSSSSAWDATLRDCVITHNRAHAQDVGRNAQGGGLWCYTSTGVFNLTVTNCVFSDNSATNLPEQSSAMGGAIYLRSGGDVVFSDSVFERNNATVIGGATLLSPYGGTQKILVRNCIYRDNWTDQYVNAMSGGGGASGACIYRNCLFVGNKTASGGGGGAVFADRNGPLYVDNCTIISNSANIGGGIYVRARSTGSTHVLIMTNSIVYYNGPNTDLSLHATHTNQISYSCVDEIAGFFEGANNITGEPGFVDWTARDYRLRANSPCVNAGVNLDWMADARDLDGNRRISWDRVDLGAYEHQVQGALLLLR